MQIAFETLAATAIDVHSLVIRIYYENSLILDQSGRFSL